MSSHIEWQPIKRGKAIHSSALKNILQSEYGFPLNVDLSYSHLGFLQGLAAADIEGAKVLVEAIEMFDEIHVETSG